MLLRLWKFIQKHTQNIFIYPCLSSISYQFSLCIVIYRQTYFFFPFLLLSISVRIFTPRKCVSTKRHSKKSSIRSLSFIILCSTAVLITKSHAAFVSTIVCSHAICYFIWVPQTCLSLARDAEKNRYVASIELNERIWANLRECFCCPLATMWAFVYKILVHL